MFERKCVKELEENGWLAVRIAGSGQSNRIPFDILACRRDALSARPIVILVECKMGGRISKEDRERLLSAAEMSGGAAILATVSGWSRVLPSGAKADWHPGI